MKGMEEANSVLGGVGGASPTRKTRGVTAVEMIAKIRTYNDITKLDGIKRETGRLTDPPVLPSKGLKSCPSAFPTGLASTESN
jgi:hypothetical protein